ncbi:hypothetical protein E2320_002217, partial [Naja naja]
KLVTNVHGIRKREALGDWIKIGVHLHSEPRAPIQHLLLLQTCKEAVETVGTSFSAPPGGVRTSSLCTIDSASTNINAARNLLTPPKSPTLLLLHSMLTKPTYSVCLSIRIWHKHPTRPEIIRSHNRNWLPMSMVSGKGKPWEIDKNRVHLHSEPRAPIQHLLLWQTCKEAVETVGTSLLLPRRPHLLPMYN